MFLYICIRQISPTSFDLWPFSREFMCYVKLLKFWRLQIWYDGSYGFFKTVISQLNSDLTIDSNNLMQLKIFYCSFCVYYLLGSMLKPFGYSVYNFGIQKFSLSISCWMGVSLDFEVFVNWSMMVNFACLLKLQFSCWKCLQAIITSTFFTSFRWLFSHIKACLCFSYILFIT